MKTASTIKSSCFLTLTLVLLVSTSFAQKQKLSEKSVDKADLLKMRIKQAGDNQSELKKAIKTVPSEHRQALEFLLTQHAGL